MCLLTPSTCASPHWCFLGVNATQGVSREHWVFIPGRVNEKYKVSQIRNRERKWKRDCRLDRTGSALLLAGVRTGTCEGTQPLCSNRGIGVFVVYFASLAGVRMTEMKCVDSVDTVLSIQTRFKALCAVVRWTHNCFG